MKKELKAAAAAAPKGKADQPKAAAPKGNGNGHSKADQPKGFDIHVNNTGRVCFGRSAAARLSEAGFTIDVVYYMLLVIDKGIIRLEPTLKESEIEVRNGGGRPYISLTRQMRPLGFEPNTGALDVVAKPYGKAGFEFAWRDVVKADQPPAAAPKGKAADQPKGNGKAPAAAAPKGKKAA